LKYRRRHGFPSRVFFVVEAKDGVCGSVIRDRGHHGRVELLRCGLTGRRETPISSQNSPSATGSQAAMDHGHGPSQSSGVAAPGLWRIQLGQHYRRNPGVSPETLERWRDIAARLERHERGHIEIGVAAARAVSPPSVS
jgi:hypothetical protein